MKTVFILLLTTLSLYACTPAAITLGVHVATQLAEIYLTKYPQPRNVTTEDVETQIREYIEAHRVDVNSLNEKEKLELLQRFHVCKTETPEEFPCK
jgi:hypothetical protein